jgi:hypothetical protein
MRRPGLVTYALGNPVSVVGLSGAACFCIYEWWTGQGAGLLALVVALVAISSVNASERLSTYGQWKREWQAMGGETPRSFVSPRAFRVLHITVVAVIWVGAALVVLTEQREPGMQIPAAMFWLATVIAAIAGIRKMLRRGKRSAPQRAKDVPVTLCVRIPAHSTTLNAAFANLPDYCLTLFRS